MADETQTLSPATKEAKPVDDVKTSPAGATDPVPPVTDDEKKPTKEAKIAESVSFKEESNFVSDLPDHQKKALEELKQLIQDSLNKHEFSSKEAEQIKSEAKPNVPASDPELPSKTQPEEPTKVSEAHAPTTAAVAAVAASMETVSEDDGAKTVEAIEESVVSVTSVEPSEEKKTLPSSTVEPASVTVDLPPEEVFIWGIPLVGTEKSDVLLLKFLRARDFKVKDAFTMIKNTVRWREEFGIEKLMDEDLGHDFHNVVFMSGFDKEGHPVCYNVYGEFQNPELYDKAFADAERRQRFLRWRIQFLERGIRRQLDFSPGGVCTFVQVNDLRNSPGPTKRELRQATNQALAILQDNYPELVAKQIFINVPWWYIAVNRMISPFLTQRTRSKFVFAGTSKSTDTLFRYISPEQVPIRYGGLNEEHDPDFSSTDPIIEIIIKPASKHTVEVLASQTCTILWELRVPGWDVSCGAEFIPNAEDGYTVIIQKRRKMAVADEPILKNTFKIGEPGKVVLTIDNTSSKKKKLLYRTKTKASTDAL